MAKLPLEKISINSRDYFYLGKFPDDMPVLLECVLLAGFDPWMLRYKKEKSIFCHKNICVEFLTLQKSLCLRFYFMKPAIQLYCEIKKIEQK